MRAAPIPCWQALPRLAKATIALRNALAWQQHAWGERYHELNGTAWQFRLSDGLAAYPLLLTLEGGGGMLVVGLDVASLLPEVSLDVVSAIQPAAQRMEALEWLLMPWLEALETWTGCQLRITDVRLRHALVPGAFVAIDARRADGCRGHVALAGEGLDLLAHALPRAAAVPPTWCRIDAAWLLNLGPLSLKEMQSITTGALVRCSPSVLHLQLRMGNGSTRMSAHWSDDDHVQLGGRVGDRPGLPVQGDADEPLLRVDELSFEVDVVLATQQFTVEQLAGLCTGAVMPLSPTVDGQRVSLMHRGAVFARGELAYVEDELVVVITESPGSSRR